MKWNHINFFEFRYLRIHLFSLGIYIAMMFFGRNSHVEIEWAETWANHIFSSCNYFRQRNRSLFLQTQISAGSFWSLWVFYSFATYFTYADVLRHNSNCHFYTKFRVLRESCKESCVSFLKPFRGFYLGIHILAWISAKRNPSFVISKHGEHLKIWNICCNRYIFIIDISFGYRFAYLA